MTETVTVRGFVGSDVRSITTEKGLPISTFRLASTPRRYDRERGEWVDGDTNWFTVTCFRSLAQNVHSTLSKGDPVLVTGRLKVRQWSTDAGQRGTAVDVDADGVGHDLTFGTGSFTRLGGQQGDSSAAWGTSGEATDLTAPEGRTTDEPATAWDGAEAEQDAAAAPF